MKAYRIAARGAARHFTINGGLQEGYGPSGKLHTMEEVIEAHHDWQSERRQPFGVLISQSDPSYGWPTDDGGFHSAVEPGFKVEGGINVFYDANLTDEEALERILSLAEFIATRLGQTRVYVSYKGEDIIIQAPDKKTPRE